MIFPAATAGVYPQLGKVAASCNAFLLASTPLVQAGHLCCPPFASPLLGKESVHVASMPDLRQRGG